MAAMALVALLGVPAAGGAPAPDGAAGLARVRETGMLRCGKTTLLRALNYLTPFDTGEVRAAGQRLRPGLSERCDAAVLRAVRIRVGMVFQSFHLFPHLSALDNVAEAPRRVLAMEPMALLLDEPTSALDPRMTGEILAVVRDLAAAGQTMVVVTHAIAFARQVAGRVAVLVDGRIVEQGVVHEVLDRPQHPATRVFLTREEQT